MRKLYEIRDDILLAIESMISGEESDISPKIELEDLDIEAREKIRNCFYVIQRLKAEIAEAEIVAKQAQAYKSIREKAVDRIEADIKITMEVMGLDKINEPDHRITLGKPREKVEIVDESLIPSTYLRVIPEKREPDKVAILTALKNGAEITGAKIGFGEPSLTYPKIKGVE